MNGRNGCMWLLASVYLSICKCPYTTVFYIYGYGTEKSKWNILKYIFWNPWVFYIGENIMSVECVHHLKNECKIGISTFIEFFCNFNYQRLNLLVCI